MLAGVQESDLTGCVETAGPPKKHEPDFSKKTAACQTSVL